MKTLIFDKNDILHVVALKRHIQWSWQVVQTIVISASKLSLLLTITIKYNRMCVILFKLFCIMKITGCEFFWSQNYICHVVVCVFYLVFVSHSKHYRLSDYIWCTDKILISYQSCWSIIYQCSNYYKQSI